MPTITQNPSNVTLLSNISLVIPCGVDAAPFPEVTWTKDGMAINFTLRVHISRYDAALVFESQGVEDSGDYQCSLTNLNGTAESNVATIVVLGENTIVKLFCVAILLYSICSKFLLFTLILSCVAILEATCFDNTVTRFHETDRDCGGEFCVPCNITQVMVICTL